MDTNTLMGKVVMGILRHSISSIAAGYVAKGLMTQDQATTAVSAAVALLGVGLSVYNSMQQHAAAQAQQPQGPT